MKLVEAELSHGVARITLNDPERRNALNAKMVAQLEEAFDRIEADADVRAVVVTGANPAFCSGADLNVLLSGDMAAFRRVYDAFVRILRCPLPTIAAVNGVAVGAGFNMALACDLRLTTPKAKLVSRFLDIGLHPGGGHAWMLNRLAGSEIAKAAILFGQSFDGESAVAAGLALRCVTPDQLLAEADALATRAASAPREVLMRAKASIESTIAIPDHATAMEIEAEAQAWSATLPHVGERIAQLSKRVKQ